jgi:hypothetical protein
MRAARLRASGTAEAAADGDAEGERDGIEISGGGAQSDVAFREFDGDQAEGEGSDDGFASEQIGGVVEVAPGELRVLEPEQKFGAESGAGDRGGDHRPAQGSDDGVAEAAAEHEVNGKCDDVGEAFEEEVRVECEAAEVEKEREGCGMGRGDDGGTIASSSAFTAQRKEAPLLTQTTREKWGNRIR